MSASKTTSARPFEDIARRQGPGCSDKGRRGRRSHHGLHLIVEVALHLLRDMIVDSLGDRGALGRHDLRGDLKSTYSSRPIAHLSHIAMESIACLLTKGRDIVDTNVCICSTASYDRDAEATAVVALAGDVTSRMRR